MAECPTVKTTCGLVKGKVSKAVDKTAEIVYQFLGIRYGQAPTGKLRFCNPLKAKPWEGTFQAVHTFKNCPQIHEVSLMCDEMLPSKNELNFDPIAREEDCLKLNIFTPECDDKAKLPVMVYFTGGHYQRLAGGRTSGSALAGMNNVVNVVLNHRVNAFGFLSLGKNSCCPGNLGLRDAILALEWIRNNAKAFGGDPDNVTLFGESSGSGMIHLLMMSPLSRGLFHKAILMSGTVLSSFLFSDDLAVVRDLFLKQFGLDAKTMEDGDILEKLQSLSVEQILEAQKGFTSFTSFLPCVDGHVITDTPAQLIKAGQVSPVPLLIGCTNSDGTGLLSMLNFSDYEKGLSEEVVKATFKATYLHMYKDGDAEDAYQTASKFYRIDENSNDPLRYSEFQGNMVTDTIFLVPSIAAASAHVAMGQPTYFYEMTQQLEFSHSETNGPEVRKKPEFVRCDHADDLFFVLGVPFIEGKLSLGAHFTDDEVELSRHVMRYFTNFAKSGNPNKPVNVEVEWPAYTADAYRQHMVLQIPLETDKNLGLEKAAFYQKQMEHAKAHNKNVQ
ncbi:fatty acyl-CoA hydrolase precursor, medium chain-like [Clavelina lepadiformis]|uniref:fatty acyl-CoA hydrolase precursor, medium chain-like n=1 Tax=Clavelina lepadiformis TaxID=159417 RepID=UPI004042B9AB